MKNKFEEFSKKYSLSPELINVSEQAEKIRNNMLSAMKGTVVDIPMFPSYLSCEGALREGENVIVIDAGGTNYRSGLACFRGGSFSVSEVSKAPMPGSGGNKCSWEEFISFTADSIEPFLDRASVLGFCFSYSAEITPEKDARVITIDKEVSISGCEGKLLGQSINEELERRGRKRLKIIVLNDTVAAMLGGMASLKKEDYSGFAGMICGTGFNICLSYGGMLYNTESGYYLGMPQSALDKAVDEKSLAPGEKLIEKMISGAYLGLLCREGIIKAVEEGLIAPDVLDRLNAFERPDGALTDAWASGRDDGGILCSEEAIEFAGLLARSIMSRSAKCAASALIGAMLLSGSEEEKPFCVCAEGSLIAKSERFRSCLDKELEEFALGNRKLNYVISLGKDTTLPGSASAALLN